jgi:DNA modification methylase
MNNYTTETEPKAWASEVPIYCAHDKIVDVAALVPNPKNPNTHPDNQIQLLGRIIRETGWRAPITVSTRSGYIVKGQGRLAAALLEGFKAVPVDYQHYDSEAQEYADLVADNRIAELAEIDNKMLADIFADIDTGEIPLELTGYTEAEVEDIVTALSEALHNDLDDPDDVPEVPEPEKVLTQPGDLWILGRHRLLCGDSTNPEDVDKLMDGAKADMVFTDPPYALFGNSTGVCGVGDDKMIMPFFREIGRMIQRHLKQMGHAYVCHDWQTGATIKEAFGGLTAKNLIVWRKAEAGGLGSYYTKIYELIWLFANEPELGIVGKNKPKARTINGVANIWDCPVVQAPERDHNAQKPVNLINIAIENSSDPDENVLDLFGGSGSTMISCEQLYRNCYLMEMEPKYCDVIVRRYIKTTGKNSGIRLIRKGEDMGRDYFSTMFEG